jgi:hypothetical protein
MQSTRRDGAAVDDAREDLEKTGAEEETWSGVSLLPIDEAGDDLRVP